MRLIPNRRHDRVLIQTEGPQDDNGEFALVTRFDARAAQPRRQRTDTDRTLRQWAAPFLYSVPLGRYKTKAPLIAAIRRAGITLINAPRQHGARR